VNRNHCYLTLDEGKQIWFPKHGVSKNSKMMANVQNNKSYLKLHHALKTVTYLMTLLSCYLFFVHTLLLFLVMSVDTCISFDLLDIQ
jgi:hypothetical protein